MNIFNFFKPKNIIRKKEPWLEYYSKENNEIKFTTKTIYQYLKESVGDDLSYYALNYFNHRITYKELFEKIDIASNSLKVLGVKPKDIVTICMPNTPEAVILFYAINKIGAIADMVHPLSSVNEIKNFLTESKSKVVLMIDFNYEKIEKIKKDTNIKKIIVVSPKESMPNLLKIGYDLTRGWKNKKVDYKDHTYITWTNFLNLGIHYNDEFKSLMRYKDTAIILHSGGTTGTPKGIMVTNYNFNSLAQQGAVNVLRVRPKDRIATILPIFHGFGLGVCIHCPLCLKVETILIPEFNAKSFSKMLKNLKPNV